MPLSALSWLDISLLLFALYLLQKIAKRKHCLPPGPKGFPLIGNVLDMPSEKEWLTFSKWGDEYGDISSITILGQPIIILNSARAAVDMLDKKSSIYSDRPVLQMCGELVGWKNTLALLPYGDRFRRYRKLFHNLIGSPSTMKRFYPAEELESRRFLKRVLAKPGDLAVHIRKTAGAVILRISHGYEVKENNDPFVQLADLATEQFSLAASPGQFLVDVVPALRMVPDWCPGAQFKRTARSWASTLSEMVEQPYLHVKRQMAAGTAPISFTSSILESKALGDQEEFDLKWSAASLYSGAADTTVSAIYAFFLAMTLHPEVVRKAQAEIDHITGGDRLPTFADREYLPYVDALVKEVFRWNTVVPMALPHRATRDDVHEGYFIPKGSLILPNVWKMCHDSRTYASPDVFNPDRFVPAHGKLTEPDPRTIAFGFGRRSCPGMHLADASVFISCATSLAVFDVEKKVDNGVTIYPVHEQMTGTISHPLPFHCNIKPRSRKAVALIQADEYDH